MTEAIDWACWTSKWKQLAGGAVVRHRGRRFVKLNLDPTTPSQINQGLVDLTDGTIVGHWTKVVPFVPE